MGSEMCIRDRPVGRRTSQDGGAAVGVHRDGAVLAAATAGGDLDAVSYTHLTLPTIYSV